MSYFEGSVHSNQVTFFTYYACATSRTCLILFCGSMRVFHEFSKFTYCMWPIRVGKYGRKFEISFFHDFFKKFQIFKNLGVTIKFIVNLFFSSSVCRHTYCYRNSILPNMRTFWFHFFVSDEF